MFLRRTLSTLVLVTMVACFMLPVPAKADPLLANYFLSNLPTDADSIAKLSRFHVLVIQPWEAIANRAVVDTIKQKNPKIIILAYVPTKSYDVNWQNYPANLVYRDFNVRDDWWLKDASGNITSDWPGHKNTNLANSYSDYLVSYLKSKVFSNGLFDGIFWDVVYDSISFQNGGNLDLNGDGVRDDRTSLDAEWNRRMQYLLDTSRAQLGIKYVVFNGTSIASLQTSVNGRMYENFPTPWEAGGSWGGLMTKLVQNQKINPKPQIYIFNANTNNTGNQGNLSAMRFGLGSSLLVNNTYFSYDYGSNDHSQIWMYDEYGAKLGEPAGEPVSASGAAQFKDDVWRRDYDNGLVLVNATRQNQRVDLGGEYEAFSSTQDTTVNNGEISDRIDLPARDSAILFKTIKTLTNAVFTNGLFARFYLQNGARARNGFFVFEDSYAGGAKIYNGDLNGDGLTEKIVVTRNKMEIFNASGERWYNDFPFGANIKGYINLAVGKLNNDSEQSIVVTRSEGSGEVKIFNFHGGLVKSGLYPLGNKYNAGFSVAVASDGGKGRIILGVGKNYASEVLGVDASNGKIVRRFFPYGRAYRGGINVATGDFNGDGNSEIVTVSRSDLKPVLRVFSLAGKQSNEFRITGFFGRQEVSLAAMDVNFEGKMEIVALTSN